MDGQMSSEGGIVVGTQLLSNLCCNDHLVLITTLPQNVTSTLTKTPFTITASVH